MFELQVMKTWQNSEKLVLTIKHMQVSKWNGTGVYEGVSVFCGHATQVATKMDAHFFKHMCNVGPTDDSIKLLYRWYSKCLRVSYLLTRDIDIYLKYPVLPGQLIRGI